MNDLRINKNDSGFFIKALLKIAMEKKEVRGVRKRNSQLNKKPLQMFYPHHRKEVQDLFQNYVPNR